MFLVYFYLQIYRAAPPAGPAAAKQSRWTEQASEEPLVLIKVLPLELGKQAPEWKFQVTFTTHAGSLDFDPVSVFALADDQANSYPPLAWQGPGPGGHHRGGALNFKATTPAPKYVELKIKDVGGIRGRAFRWSLE